MTNENFDKAKHLRHFLLTRIAECITYKSWSDEFVLQRIKETKNEYINKYGKIDISSFKEEEYNELHFGIWSQDSEMRLIPLWMYDFLQEDVELSVECVDGEINELLPKDIDNDHRFGYLAFGV